VKLKRFSSLEMSKRDIFLMAVLLVLGAVQAGNLWLFFGVGANFVLAFLVVLAFFIRDTLSYFIFVFIGLFSLNFTSGFELGLFLTGIFGVLVFYLRSYLLEDSFSTVVLLVTTLTFAFYLIVDFRFLISSFGVVLLEAVYNVLVAIIVFEGLSYAKKKRVTV